MLQLVCTIFKSSEYFTNIASVISGKFITDLKFPNNLNFANFYFLISHTVTNVLNMWEYLLTSKIIFRTSTFNIPTVLILLIDPATPTVSVPYVKDFHLN